MHESLGKTQTRSEWLDPIRAETLGSVLGVRVVDPLPAFFHQIYFWDVQPSGALGRDGHPAVGQDGFIPSFGLPRRMWAGGRLRLHHPLRIAHDAEKRSEITAISEKFGRSGALAFVTITHRITQGDLLCVEEDQDLVYRAEADPQTPAPSPTMAPEDADPETLTPDPVMLFRYSALTLNGHRIHYDADYARDVEGYDGVVVHGPLLAQWMLLRAERRRPVRRFAFRGRKPLILGEDALCCQADTRLWVRNGAGHLIMEADVAWD